MGLSCSQCISNTFCSEKDMNLQQKDNNPLAFTPMHDSEVTQQYIATEQPESDNQGITKEEIIKKIENAIQRFDDIYQSDPLQIGFSLQLDKEGCKVYSKDTENGYLMRSEWETTVEASKFSEFISKVDIRPKWDSNIQHLHLIQAIDDEVRIYHQLYKKMFTMAPRDILIVNRKFKQDDCYLDICTSIDAPQLVQIAKGTVRAYVELGGYHIQPIKDSKNQYKAKITSISDTNFGGSIPLSMAKRVAVSTVPKFAKTLEKAIKDHLE